MTGPSTDAAADEREVLAAAIIDHQHPTQNALTKPDDALTMVRSDPRFFVCSGALALADSLLAAGFTRAPQPERAARDHGLRERVERVLDVPPSDDDEWITADDYRSCTVCNCGHCDPNADQWCPMAVLALVERKVEDRDEQVRAVLADDAADTDSEAGQ